MGTGKSSGMGYVWRSVAASLLLLFAAALSAPFAQAQAEPQLPACCRMAGRAGCSHSMHRAEAQRKAGHQLASLQAKCPCTPLAPSGIASHDAPMASVRNAQIALPRSRAPSHDEDAHDVADRSGDEDTRGPPTAHLA